MIKKTICDYTVKKKLSLLYNIVIHTAKNIGATYSCACANAYIIRATLFSIKIACKIFSSGVKYRRKQKAGKNPTEKERDIMQNNLIKLRKEKGLSQEELADKLAVSRQAISKWERGESLPDTDNLIRLAKLYGVSIDEIVGIKDSGEDAATAEKSAAASPAYASEENLESGESTSEKEPTRTDENGKKTYNKRNIVIDSVCGAYVILTTVAVLLWGFMFNGWILSWTLYVTIPVFISIFECVRKRKLTPFNFPCLITFVYLFLGMSKGLWHPLWIMFVSVPLFYVIANAVDGKSEKPDND